MDFSKWRPEMLHEIEYLVFHNYFVFFGKIVFFFRNSRFPVCPPCNMDQVITPLGDMTCCISNLSHMQN
jgi:hypothetical protein